MSNKILSVIIPIYNVEKYLSEALDSVVNQDIGFEENIQLILINDGSPDNSEEICLDYEARYPNNIIYIAQKNQGVSAARNKGLDTATGKYIAFFDPDDILSLDAYRLAVEFFEDNYEKVDIVAFKMRFFERFTGDHPLNYRFDKGSRVVDVRSEPTFMQSSGVSCVYKSEALAGRGFDTAIRFAEDMKLINEVILEKMQYGLVDGPVYYVRKRMEENSASNTGHLNPDYYTVTPVKVFKHLFDLWEKKNGLLDEFIQFVVMFDLQFRVSQPKQVALSDEEEATYRSNIASLVKRVTNDEIILGMPKMKMAYKLFLLRQKYGDSEFHERLSIKRGELHFGDIEIPGALPGVGIDRIECLGDGKVRIEGYVSGLVSKSAKYWVETRSSGVVSLEKNPYRSVFSRNIFLGSQVDINEAFVVDLTTDGNEEISFMYGLGGDAVRLRLKTSYVSGLGNIKGAYRRYDEFIMENNKESLTVKPASAANAVFSELRFLFAILGALKIGVAKRELRRSLDYGLRRDLSVFSKLKCIARPFLIPAKALTLNILTILFRLLARMVRRVKRRPLWLISDRISDASDNGEVFYEYLRGSGKQERYLFAINKKSPTYQRLKSRGFKLVDMLGIRYKFLILVADRVISSNADELIFNPFLDQWSRFVDLMDFRFVFLQHGIIKDDLSTQYNRWNSKFDMFVTSTKDEYRSILDNKNYGFSDKEVKLTGLPRFDKLHDNSKGRVALVPTWRKGLDGGLDKITGLRRYSDTFKNTEYFKYYNKLINDNRLKEVFSRFDIKGEFYLHPSFGAQLGDFDSDGCFEIKTPPYDFNRIFAESNLLITDYSSVAFDFAYLKKPVIYAQFDKESFFNSHTYKEGYFSYGRDGFGPVLEDYDDLISEIINQVETGFGMREVYLSRVKDQFRYYDAQNSKRVYTAIKSL